MPVDESSMPATRNSPPMIAEHDERTERRQHREPGERLVGAGGPPTSAWRSPTRSGIDSCPPVSTMAPPRCSQNALVNASLLRSRHRPRSRQPHGRPHRLQRRLRPAAGDRPRLHGRGSPPPSTNGRDPPRSRTSSTGACPWRSTAATSPRRWSLRGAASWPASCGCSPSAGSRSRAADLDVDTTVPGGFGAVVELGAGGRAHPRPRDRRRRSTASTPRASRRRPRSRPPACPVG